MRNFFMKNRVFISTALVVAMLITMLPFGTYAAAAAHTVCATVPLNLRASASTSASVLKTLSEGAVMTLMENSDKGWAHITGGGYTGYASTAYLTLPAGSDVSMTGTATDDVNLRSGKGTSYSAYTFIPQGTTVTVTDNTDEEWASVKYGSYTGYVSKDYLTINFTLPKQSTSPTDPAVAAPTAAPTSAPTSAHRGVSFDGLPQSNSGDGSADDSSRIILCDKSVSLDINATFKLTVMDSASRPLTAGVKFSSSASKVASVSSTGVVKGVGSGKATITVTEVSSGAKDTCVVTVSSNIIATEAPTQKPTQAPTQAPTQKPTQAPTQPPTQAPTQKPTVPSNETLTISAASATVYKGCYYQIIAKSNTTVKWSSSNSSVAAVSSDGIVTAQAAGTAVITASTSTKSATCKITVVSGTSVSLSHTSATVTAGKTFLARSYTSGVTWTSSNTSVATVNNGYILAKNEGKSVVTVSTSKGAATILVTVKAAAPIRFAYTSPNCAVKNQTVTFIAITDAKRTAVRFSVSGGSDSITVNATSTKDGSTLVWKGTAALAKAGTYKVTAYSQYNGVWSTCSDGATTAFVSDTTDRTTPVCTQRRASSEVIKLIAVFEGYISSIYDDPITGDPTVGYGRVIFSGEQFYNTMTKNEAFAYLVQTVNNDGYSSSVNSLLVGNGVKFNQQQFDALVCLVYNTGSGILSGDSELRDALLNCSDGSSGSTVYYINGDCVRIRKGPGTEYDIIDELDYNTIVTVISTSNSAWYQVRLADGTTGYVCSDYISKRNTGGGLNLNYVNRQNLINKLCMYHHAGGSCIYGLLYRRVDEMEMFLYGDYECNYGVYKYDISFKCTKNPSFHT